VEAILSSMGVTIGFSSANSILLLDFKVLFEVRPGDIGKVYEFFAIWI